MVTRPKYLHHVVGGVKRGHRQHSAAKRFAEDHAVGFDVLVLARQELARAPHSRLDLVADQQHAALAADPRALREITPRRHDDASLALDGLDQEGGGVRRDCRFQRAHVAERNRSETGSERAETVAELRLRGEADDGDRAAVKIAVADDDFGAAVGDAFDLVAPLARSLERGFHRLRAAVGGQRPVEPGDFGQLAQK